MRTGLLLLIAVLLPLPALAGPLITNFNVDAVQNGPPADVAWFHLSEPCRITQITTYHWNNGEGMFAGTISLIRSDGREVGRWSATGRDGQGGVPNAYWNVHIDLALPSGDYGIVDSHPSTWSWNEGTGGKGMFEIHGEPAGESNP